MARRGGCGIRRTPHRRAVVPEPARARRSYTPKGHSSHAHRPLRTPVVRPARRRAAPAGSVLSDPSGRRAALLRRAGRLVAGLFVLWLAGLVLAGLGLLPADGLPYPRGLAETGQPKKLETVPRAEPPAAADLAPARAAAPGTAGVGDGTPASAPVGSAPSPSALHPVTARPSAPRRPRRRPRARRAAGDAARLAKTTTTSAPLRPPRRAPPPAGADHRRRAPRPPASRRRPAAAPGGRTKNDGSWPTAALTPSRPSRPRFAAV